MSRIKMRYPATGSVDITNHAAKETATEYARLFTEQTKRRHTVEWADDYNDYSATGHYNIVEH